MSNDSLINPEETIFIIFGAEDWSLSGLGSSNSFSRSASEIISYIGDKNGMGIRSDLILNLFNSPAPATQQITIMKDFIDEIIEHQSTSISIIIIYYIGHGTLDDQGNLSFLVRSSRKNLESETGIKASDISRIIKLSAPRRRRLIILDCCFSEAAVKSFIGMSTISHVAAAMTSQGLHADSSATLIFCSSAAGEVSFAPKNMEYTLFTGSLIYILKEYQNKYNTHPSLVELRDKVFENMLFLFGNNSPQPVLYQTSGQISDLTRIPILVNSEYKINRDIRYSLKDDIDILMKLDADIAAQTSTILTEREQSIEHVAQRQYSLQDDSDILMKLDADIAAQTSTILTEREQILKYAPQRKRIKILFYAIYFILLFLIVIYIYNSNKTYRKINNSIHNTIENKKNIPENNNEKSQFNNFIQGKIFTSYQNTAQINLISKLFPNYSHRLFSGNGIYFAEGQSGWSSITNIIDKSNFHIEYEKYKSIIDISYSANTIIFLKHDTSSDTYYLYRSNIDYSTAKNGTINLEKIGMDILIKSKSSILSAKISPNELYIFALDDNGYIYVIDSKTSNVKKYHINTNSNKIEAISPTNKMVIISRTDGYSSVLGLEKNDDHAIQLLGELKTIQGIGNYSFSDDGSSLSHYSGGDNIDLYTTSTLTKNGIIPIDNVRPNYIQYIENSHIMYTDNNSIYFYSLSTKKLCTHINIGNIEYIAAMQFGGSAAYTKINSLFTFRSTCL